MLLEKLSVGVMGVNCYITGDKDEAIVIDPGANSEKICAFLKQNDIKVKYVVLTHCHFDHITAAEDVLEFTGAELVSCKNEAENLLNENVNMTGRFSKNVFKREADLYVSEGDVIKSGDVSFKVIETPGHTSGGMCLYSEDEDVVFTGDTLFCQSIGRSDFPSGNFNDLMLSIKNKLLKLPPKTRVLPGHDMETTIENEIKNNPYLK